MSERKGRAAACSYKGLINIFYFVLCLGVFLWAFALFSYNSFLFGFFVVLFVWAVTYPSFSCPLIIKQK